MMKGLISKLKRLSGAHIYVDIFQLASLLPLVYILISAGSYTIFTREGFTSALFDLGINALPRVWILALSLLYRLTLNEVLVSFALAAGALVYGIVMKRALRREGGAKALRCVLAVLIAADIAVRLLPLRVNTVFAPGYRWAGLAVRLICLALVAADLIAARREKMP